jgi:hypothetical protein
MCFKLFLYLHGFANLNKIHPLFWVSFVWGLKNKALPVNKPGTTKRSGTISFLHLWALIRSTRIHRMMGAPKKKKFQF